MTSIRETASETLHFTAVLGWFDADGLGPEITASPSPLTGIPWEPLLQLDAPGWARVFADNDVDRDFTRRLDRLVAAWLTQEDYRELREIASKKTDLSVGGAAEAVFSDWINDSACKRLSHLVMGMRFNEPQTPVCYALCNAERAVLSAVDYSRRPQGLSEQAIAAAKLELEESADEYAAMASLGILDEPPEGTKLKPRWDVHLIGDDDQPGYAGESLSSVLGE